ncbi:MAG: S1 RNA-binding domain-containing protein [Bacteroidota bacterium]
MIKPGFTYKAEIANKTNEGYELIIPEHQAQITMPKNMADSGLLKGDQLDVFVYLNQQGEPEATSKQVKAKANDFVTLKVNKLTPAGAFLDWGLPIDLFMPRSFHEPDLQEGDYCLVKVFYDEPTNKLLAKERLDDELSNEQIDVKEKEVVECIIYRDTPIGYQVIINKKHLGILHYNEVFKDLYIGDEFTGFVKKIKEDGKIDVMIGKPGYTRVADESSVVLNALKQAGGFLPYHDKSSPEDIYKQFGMSKKTFKMTLGKLYKERKITITEEGIRKS